jgi:hypothetical protein
VHNKKCGGASQLNPVFGEPRPKSNYLLEPEPEPKLLLLSIYQRLEKLKKLNGCGRSRCKLLLLV